MMRVRRTVAVVLTVKNDPAGCAETLQSLQLQTRRPDEIVLVDGGSSDETVAIARGLACLQTPVQIIEAPGANIARGRNLGTQHASTEIIATTDSGCRAEPDWLEKLVLPFEDDPRTEQVAGFYKIAPQSLLESAAGLCTMRGQLEPVSAESFNASGRSMAYTKELWRRCGGWPEWIGYSEDTLFSRQLRSLGARCTFAPEAVVHWRPRTSIGAIGRQFFNYGTGRGHTQIGAREFAYHLRNLAFLVMALSLGFVTRWGLALFGVLFLYFWVWTFHSKAVRVHRHIGRAAAYPIALFVTWVVLISYTAGYVVGTLQRRRDRERFERRMQVYVAMGS